MPQVSIVAVKGRTVEQKRGLAKDITEAVVKNFNVTPDKVTITIHEVTEEAIAKNGKLFIDAH